MKDIYIDENFQFDSVDSRDYKFKPDTSTQVPLSADLRPHAREIENQGSTGSCVANATVSALEILLDKYSTYTDLSRLFLYYELRKPYENLHGKDKGSYTRDGFKVPSKLGIAKESCWGFEPSKIHDEPDKECYTEALNRMVRRYQSIDGRDKVHTMKIALSEGIPLLIGMPLSRDFYSISGPLKTHNYKGYDSDTSIGGHAMCVVGYDDQLGGFIVENSWGKDWGDNGYCLLSYEVAEDDFRDIWACTAFEKFDADIKDLKVNKNITVEAYQESDSNEFTVGLDQSWAKNGKLTKMRISQMMGSGIDLLEVTDTKIRFKYRETGRDRYEHVVFFLHVYDDSAIPQNEVVYYTHRYKLGVDPNPEPEPKKEETKSFWDKYSSKILTGAGILLVGALIYLNKTGVL